MSGFRNDRRASRLGVVSAVVGLTIVLTWWSTRGERARPAKRLATTGAVKSAAESPYRNVRSDVGYVGDAACARCHTATVAAFQSHPMGRSLSLVAKWSPTLADARAGLPVKAGGFEYGVEYRDGRIYHIETKRDANGAGVVAEAKAAVRYALGSGTRGVAFLVERDGFLFQSPLSWYAQTQRYDLAPGYESNNPHFERPIGADCLFCHSDRAELVPGTENRFEPPTFRGCAIGCERCHGPGALHVEQADRGDDIELTIVNPAKLPSGLRASVCNQCHLLGSLRFPTAGRHHWDFRPGLPLDQFVAVFFKRSGRGPFESVGHVEQMESSRCFTASAGALGCTSCHDPHRLPPSDQKVSYFRARCLECHAQRGCALPAAERRAANEADDCVACHMPRSRLSNIPHAAATDHRIARAPGGKPGPDDRTATASLPLIDYRGLRTGGTARVGAERDMGMALSQAAWLLRSSPRQAVALAHEASPRLKAAVASDPDDLPAWESLGTAEAIDGRTEEAMQAFQAVLRAAPARESALRSAASLAADIRTPQESQALWQKAIRVNPWRSDYHVALGSSHYRAGQWPEALAACRAALALNPFRTEARTLIVQACLKAGDLAAAESEYQTLLRLSPGSRDAWSEWFERQKAELMPGTGR